MEALLKGVLVNVNNIILYSHVPFILNSKSFIFLIVMIQCSYNSRNCHWCMTANLYGFRHWFRICKYLHWVTCEIHTCISVYTTYHVSKSHVWTYLLTWQHSNMCDMYVHVLYIQTHDMYIWNTWPTHMIYMFWMYMKVIPIGTCHVS